jgi:hypothetical protein
MSRPSWAGLFAFLLSDRKKATAEATPFQCRATLCARGLCFPYVAPSRAWRSRASLSDLRLSRTGDLSL